MSVLSGSAAKSYLPRLLDTAAEKDAYFVFTDGVSENKVSIVEFRSRVASTATMFLERGVGPRSTVGILIDDNCAFLVSFFAASWAGLIPVPLAPPTSRKYLQSYLHRLQNLFESADCSTVVVSPLLKTVLGKMPEQPPQTIISTSELSTDTHNYIPPHDTTADDIAFLQFSSGSTSQPKGAEVRNSNLDANIRCIAESLGFNARHDVGVSWLPLFHDMGLIGMILAGLSRGLPLVSMPPMSFIKNPAIWLQAISRYNGTHSFAPNFAYGLCDKRINDYQLEGVSLDSWRIAGCGAEPIQHRTLRQFARRFAEFGFRSNALFPCYGLAESTLACTFPQVDAEMIVDRVSREVMVTEGKAIPSEEEGETLSFVNCGKVFGGHDLRIVDSDGHPCAEREVGEVHISGPSVVRGYYNNQAESSSCWDGKWFKTGDLGYLCNDELYVCGRLKECIIVSGKNYYPTDIEQIVCSNPAIRKGNAISFSVCDSTSTEQLIIIAETKEKAKHYASITKELKGAIRGQIGLVPEEVLLVPPGTLPKTSSGKLQRTQARRLYLEGSLPLRSSIKDTLSNVHLALAARWAR